MLGENTSLNMQLPSTEQRYEMGLVLSVTRLIRVKQASAVARLLGPLLRM